MKKLFNQSPNRPHRPKNIKLGDTDGKDDKNKTNMKNLIGINNKQLAELLNEVHIFDDLELCRVICDYYSKYDSPVYVGVPERFKMIALSKEGRKVYCTLSLDWESRVPYKKVAAVSMDLNFEVLAFAASWDGFSKMAKRIENLATKCTLKVFAVKNEGKDLDKEIILQLIDWIENDTIPAKWNGDVKFKTIKP